MGNRSGTSPARWESMVEFARWMRAKPAFDVEERDYRLMLAEAVRGLLDAARDRRPLAKPAEAVWRRHLAGLDPVLPPRQVGLLSEWATLDEEGLARALRSFCDGGENPDGQVAGFAEAVRTSPVAERFGAGGLAIGSL